MARQSTTRTGARAQSSRFRTDGRCAPTHGTAKCISWPRTASEWSLTTGADDLAAVIEALDLKDATLVGHSTGGGEVARYIGRHGTKRVAAAVLIAAVPPIMVKSAANPEGLPIELFDGLRSSVAKDRSQFWKDFAVMFYGANRPGANVSQGDM
jgi:non-heme chloroperoxidase